MQANISVVMLVLSCLYTYGDFGTIQAFTGTTEEPQVYFFIAAYVYALLKEAIKEHWGW